MDPLDCPSVPAQSGSVVIGVIQRRAGQAEVTMLRRAAPLRDVAHLIPDALRATDVLRLAGPCAAGICRHFADRRCSLASRVVAHLPAVSGRPPPCALRPTCRWWNQEGVAACLRCPQIVTEPSEYGPAMESLATPHAVPPPSHPQENRSLQPCPTNR